MSTRTRKPKPRLRSEAEVAIGVDDAIQALGLDMARQNTGAGVNPSGRTIKFGKPGNSDRTGMLPDGRKIDVEVKHEGFNPSKLTREKKAHFDRQLERLKKTNDQGGVGFWTDDAAQCLEWLRIFIAGGWIEEPGYGRPIIHREPRKKPNDDRSS